MEMKLSDWLFPCFDWSNLFSSSSVLVPMDIDSLMWTMRQAIEFVIWSKKDTIASKSDGLEWTSTISFLVKKRSSFATRYFRLQNMVGSCSRFTRWNQGRGSSFIMEVATQVPHRAIIRWPASVFQIPTRLGWWEEAKNPQRSRSIPSKMFSNTPKEHIAPASDTSRLMRERNKLISSMVSQSLCPQILFPPTIYGGWLPKTSTSSGRQRTFITTRFHFNKISFDIVLTIC